MTATAEVRGKLNGLVERQYYLTRSWMLAYDDISKLIGVSDDWVRKFARGDPRYGLKHEIAENIKWLADHIERGNEKMRAEDAQAHQSNSGVSEASDSASLLPPNDY